MKEYRGYYINYNPVTKHEIKSKGAGVLPKALRGNFTRLSNATAQIDYYLMMRESKGGSKVHNSGS